MDKEKKRHYIISSPPSFGKSYCFENCDEAYIWDYEQKFQDAYEGQQFIVFDAWRAGYCVKWGTLEMLTSQCPKIPRKGVEVAMPGPVNVVILSNLRDPMSVYNEVDPDIIAFRFTKVWLPDQGVEARQTSPEADDSL